MTRQFMMNLINWCVRQTKYETLEAVTISLAIVKHRRTTQLLDTVGYKSGTKVSNLLKISCGLYFVS